MHTTPGDLVLHIQCKWFQITNSTGGAGTDGSPFRLVPRRRAYPCIAFLSRIRWTQLYQPYRIPKEQGRCRCLERTKAKRVDRRDDDTQLLERWRGGAGLSRCRQLLVNTGDATFSETPQALGQSQKLSTFVKDICTQLWVKWRRDVSSTCS